MSDTAETAASTDSVPDLCRKLLTLEPTFEELFFLITNFPDARDIVFAFIAEQYWTPDVHNFFNELELRYATGVITKSLLFPRWPEEPRRFHDPHGPHRQRIRRTLTTLLPAFRKPGQPRRKKKS